MNDFSIDYERILRNADANDLEGVVRYLTAVLPEVWSDTYRTMTPTETNIHQIILPNFENLFDLTSELIVEGSVTDEEATDDRIVVIFGRSHPASVKRDASRIRGFLGGPLADKEGCATDKGHFIGHSLGGGLDINLFPQRRDINRGWSERGKVFRAMERYCADNAGTFCFSRPIYHDRTWRPHSLEYGILKDVNSLWIEQFNN